VDEGGDGRALWRIHAGSCDDWAWLSLNRRSRQLLVTCGYKRSVFFLVYDRGNRVDVCKVRVA
jgi:hypothetical protein